MPTVTFQGYLTPGDVCLGLLDLCSVVSSSSCTALVVVVVEVVVDEGSFFESFVESVSRRFRVALLAVDVDDVV